MQDQQLLNSIFKKKMSQTIVFLFLFYTTAWWCSNFAGGAQDKDRALQSTRSIQDPAQLRSR